MYNPPCPHSEVPRACPSLHCPDRAAVVLWQDPTAQRGPQTLMGEGKWEGTVRGDLFFSPRTLTRCCCGRCCHRVQGLPLLCCTANCDFLSSCVCFHVVGLVLYESSSTLLCKDVGVLTVECCVRSSCKWGCRGFSRISLLDATLQVGHVCKCAGFGFDVSNCVQGGVERERCACSLLLALRSWRLSRARVFELVLLCGIGGYAVCAGGRPRGAHIL